VKLRHLTASLVATVAATALLAGCGGSDYAPSAGGAKPTPSPSSSSQPASNGGTGSVAIDDFKFMPASLTVSQGARTTVANRDSTAHTMTADDGSSFDTGDIAPGSSATVTVSKRGTFKYHCSIHPFMHGTLVAD
jgi:plastocyanin